jgi:hypothetical protein
MTRKLPILAAAIFACAALAVASARQTPHAQTAPTPRIVPISQEHHHHLVLENSFIRAYEVELNTHESSLMHQHDQDYVYVVLGDSDITNTLLGKDPVHLHFPDGTVNFSRGSFAHITQNNDDKRFFVIAIVLLHPQGEEHTFFPSVDAALNGKPEQEGSHRDPNGAKEAVILETDECRVTGVSILENSAWEPANTGHDRLIVQLDKIADTTAPRESAAPMYPAGMLKWVPAQSPFTLRNRDIGEKKLLVLEFKDNK